MKSPQLYFGIAPQDPLYFVNVATGGEQAKKLFSRIVTRLVETKWFMDRFKIYRQGKLVKGSGSGLWGIIQISSDEIIFPKGLGMKALHSQNEKWEGYTLIGFIADELSGFTNETGQFNADKIYKTLTSSVRELPYLGLITSFPRGSEDTDFVYGLYKKAVDGNLPGMTASKYYTWEVKPSRLYSGETFDLVIDERTGQTEKVPVVYKNLALRNPEDFKKRYMCICGSTSDVGDFFEYQSRFGAIGFRSDKVTDHDEIVLDGKRMVIRKILVGHTLQRSNNYHITLDCGESESEATLTVCHRDGDKVVVDTILVWTPNPEKEIIVDIRNYQEFTFELARLLNAPVRFDHWNAASIEAFLRGRGVQCERKNVAYNEYTKMKSLLYSSNLVLPDTENSTKFIGQCKSLRSKGELKPRVRNGRQDVCDAVVQATDVLYADEELADIDVGYAFTYGGMENDMQQRQAENVFGLKKDRGSYTTRRVRDDDEGADDWGVIV